MKIYEAIEKIQEVEQANIESLRGTSVARLTQVELSIGLENGDKLVRYPKLDVLSIAEGIGELRFEADKKGITGGEIHLFAEWREDEVVRTGDKVGDEFDCVVDEAEASAICRETYGVMSNLVHQEEFLMGA